MIRAGIFGASGYMGGEALRVLHEHPEVEIVWATSRNPKDVGFFHRNLTGAPIDIVEPKDLADVDVAFFAVPTGNVMTEAPALLGKGTKVIDLGSDFRLKDRAEWERLYKKTHVAWDLTEEAVYGISELYREQIAKARVIANPGCFSTATILGCAPMVKAGLVDTKHLAVDGLSGTAGAGAELDVSMHHPELGNNAVPYNVVDHRHTYEMEQELSTIAGQPVRVHFTPIYVPITRGILAICHGFLEREVTRVEVHQMYADFYADSPWVEVVPFREEDGAWKHRSYPWVAAVSGTNRCHIGVDVDERRGRVVVFSVLDSMGKGGAHAGVENMNLMFGLDPQLGLRRYGNHPY